MLKPFKIFAIALAASIITLSGPGLISSQSSTGTPPSFLTGHPGELGEIIWD